MTVGSALDDCSLCMQKNKSLCAEFCSSMAAEEASEIFWIMSELSHNLRIMCDNSVISLGLPTFKGKQGGACVCLTHCTMHQTGSGRPSDKNLRFPVSTVLYDLKTF